MCSTRWDLTKPKWMNQRMKRWTFCSTPLPSNRYRGDTCYREKSWTMFLVLVNFMLADLVWKVHIEYHKTGKGNWHHFAYLFRSRPALSSKLMLRLLWYSKVERSWKLSVLEIGSRLEVHAEYTNWLTVWNTWKHQYTIIFPSLKVSTSDQYHSAHMLNWSLRVW